MRAGAVAFTPVFLAILGAGGTASAAPPHETARLVYSRGPRTETCPGEPDLRDAVRQRLGYDPFDDQSPRVVTIRLSRDMDYVADVSLRDADGASHARAPLVSKATDCAEIASSLALSVSIAIDPMSLVRAPPPAPTNAPPVTAPSPAMPPSEPVRDAEKPIERAATAPSAPSVGWRAMAGISGSAGALPAPSIGPTLAGGLGVSRFGFELGGRYDLPASTEGPVGGRVVGSLLLGTLAACWEPKPALFCGLFASGALFGRGEDVEHTSTDTTFYAAAGARAAFELPLRGALVGRVQLDGYAPLRPTTLRIAKADAWSSPSVFVTASLVLGLLR